MTVKIVTDTASDISPKEAQQLGIHLVPIYVRFGDIIYRDRVDISTEEFYNKLSSSNIHPQTAAPSPGDFQKYMMTSARILMRLFLSI
jgi:fatty acid-binding protein DegV